MTTSVFSHRRTFVQSIHAMLTSSVGCLYQPTCHVPATPIQTIARCPKQSHVLGWQERVLRRSSGSRAGMLLPLFCAHRDA